jgi:hypothetical protein
VAARKSLGDLEGVVAAAVLDHQGFTGVTLPIEEIADLLQAAGQPLLFVVSGHDQ